MSNTNPENNMAVIANAAELAALTVNQLLSTDKVKLLLNTSAARKNIYNAVVLALHKRLSGEIRNLPTGQFNATVRTGGHQSGAMVPNVNVQ